jgi:hypothetical protein
MPSVNRLSALMSCRIFDCLYNHEVIRGRAMRAKREPPPLQLRVRQKVLQ